MVEKSVADRIVKASGIVIVAHVLVKLSGLIWAVALGSIYGQSTTTDAFLYVFEGILLNVFFFWHNLVRPPFLPVFSNALKKDGETRAWRFASTAFNALAIVLMIMAAVGVLWPEVFIPGTEAKSVLATELLRVASPALLGLALATVTYMTLNAYKRFFLAAFGDASTRLTMVVVLLMASAVTGGEPGTGALIVGLLIGSFARLGTHLIGLRDKVRNYRPGFQFDENFKRFLLLLLPLLVGVIVGRGRDYVNNYFVLFAEGGLVTANSFGRKLYAAVGWLIPYAMSIAMFPFFCDMVNRDDREKMAGFLTGACRMMIALFLPVSFVAATLSFPLCRFLFEGGKFSLEAARQTGLANACYLLVLPAYAVEFLVMQAFFADRRMIAPTVTGIVFSFLAMGGAILFVKILGFGGDAALAAVALSYTVSRWFKTTTLIIVLRWKLPVLPPGRTLWFLARAALLTVIVTVAAAGTVLGYERLFNAYPEAARPDAWLGLVRLSPPTAAEMAPVSGVMAVKKAAFFELAAGGLAATAVFFAGAFVLRLEELFTAIKWALEKVRRRGG